MLVAICDDEKAFRDNLRTMILQYKTNRRLHIDIYEYATGEDLIQASKPFDMIFLDYQMSGMDGMAVARQLRGKNITCGIVFATNYPSFVFESFEVEPFRFLAKPITAAQIEAILTAFIRNQKLLAPIMVVDDLEQVMIPAKEIVYIEGAGKYCTIRTLSGTYKSSKTLSQVHALLPQHSFYRSHKSYVVNLYSVSAFEKGIIKLVNGENVLIGRSKMAEFKRTYFQFVKDYYIKI